MVFDRSKKDVQGAFRKHQAKCSKHSVFKPKGQGLWHTTSRKEDCKWKATITRLQGTSSWQIPSPLPSIPATTMNRIYGFNKQPRKKRAKEKVQEATQAHSNARDANSVGVEWAIVAERALAASREAAVNADVAAGSW